MGGGQLPLRGNSLFLSKGAFFLSLFFVRERDSLVFQPVHAHSGPWKETKGSQGQARLKNEGRVIDQTGELQLQRGNVGRRGGEVRGGGRLSGNTHTQRRTQAHRLMCTQEHSAAHKESLWHLARVSGGKYLPTGIITELLAVWPRWEPN